MPNAAVTDRRLRLVTGPGPVLGMTENTTPTSPSDIFLNSKAVFARYGWGRTLGYQMLNSTGFPRAFAGRWRKDTLLAWEARVLCGNLKHARDLQGRVYQMGKVRTPGARLGSPDRCFRVCLRAVQGAAQSHSALDSGLLTWAGRSVLPASGSPPIHDRNAACAHRRRTPSQPSPRPQ